MGLPISREAGLRAFLGLMILLLVGCANAERIEPPPRLGVQVSAELATIGINVEHSLGRWAGSGVGLQHVEKDGIWYTIHATCWHVVPQEEVEKNAIFALIGMFPSRYGWDALRLYFIVSGPEDADLSFLVVKGRFPILQIGEDAALADKVLVLGRPGQPGLEMSAGHVTGYGIFQQYGTKRSIYSMVTTASIRGGFSGGPMVSLETGKVVGITWGGRRTSVATPASVLKKHLAGAIEKFMSN